jgi:hypothetical protein
MTDQRTNIAYSVDLVRGLDVDTADLPGDVGTVLEPTAGLPRSTPGSSPDGRVPASAERPELTRHPATGPGAGLGSPPSGPR